MNKWILLLCGVLAGCQHSHKQKTGDAVCQTAPVFDREPTEIKLDEWAENVRFIPLETTDSVLLTGYIPQIVYHQDKLVAFNNDKIYLFNPEGKFIRIIGTKGEGPEEYLSAGNPKITPEGIRIDDSSKWLKTYGWDGKWKQTTTVPSHKNIREVLSLPDGRNPPNASRCRSPADVHPYRLFPYPTGAISDTSRISQAKSRYGCTCSATRPYWTRSHTPGTSSQEKSR